MQIASPSHGHMQQMQAIQKQALAAPPRYYRMFSLKLLFVVSLALRASALDNGLALTPQMGWNSWNHFHCGISQTIVEQTADAFISTKLST